MRNVSTTILAIALVAVSGLLLIGQRLDARWAGGEGRIEPCFAIREEIPRTFRRSEIITTIEQEKIHVAICDGTRLYVDGNTQIKLVQYRLPDKQAETQLELIQGRVIVDGVADVHVRDLVFETRGAGCEVVHYSWRDEVDITPLTEKGCTIKGQPVPPPAFQTTRFNTFTGDIVSQSPFNPATSSAVDYYRWTGLQVENFR